MELDLVIENGTVVDGSGLPGFRADVGIKDGAVVAIGKLPNQAARAKIDASDMTVSPGFIDPHTHLDPQICWDPFALPSILHGVTTVLTGNCSVSVAPCRPEHRDALALLFSLIEEVPLVALTGGIDWRWGSFGEYLASLRGNLGVNVAAMVGHSALRYYVLGEESYERSATESEVHDMRELLRASLRQGAAGFSTSRLCYHTGEGGRPIPSRLSDDDELLALARVLGEEQLGVFETDGGIDTHHYPEHIRELAGPIALQTGRSVLLGGCMSEDKFPDEWRRTHAEAARFQSLGARIFVEASPTRLDTMFAMTTTTIFQDLPTWNYVFGLGLGPKLAAYADPVTRDKMQFEAVDDNSDCFFSRDWSRVVVARVGHERNQHLVGRTLLDVAKDQHKRIIDALLDLVLDEQLDVEFWLLGAANGDDQSVAAMLRSPTAIVGAADAGAHVRTLCGAGDTSLLFSKWVRDQGLLTVEEAVRAISFIPATVLGLRSRGLLAEGYAADVVIFKPDQVEFPVLRTVTDFPGGGPRLWRDAVGIRDVIVNGEIAVQSGVITGARAGAVLSG